MSAPPSCQSPPCFRRAEVAAFCEAQRAEDAAPTTATVLRAHRAFCALTNDERDVALVFRFEERGWCIGGLDACEESPPAGSPCPRSARRRCGCIPDARLRVGDVVRWTPAYLASIGAGPTDDLWRDEGRVVALDPPPWGRGWVGVAWADRAQTVAAGNVARRGTAREGDVPALALDPSVLRERA